MKRRTDTGRGWPLLKYQAAPLHILICGESNDALEAMTRMVAFFQGLTNLPADWSFGSDADAWAYVVDLLKRDEHFYALELPMPMEKA